MFNVARLPVTAAVAIVAVVGIALLSPSSSPSATAQQSGSRQTVPATENGIQFSFKVPTNGWERHRSIGAKKSAGGRSRSTSPSRGRKVQRRSSIGQASPTATTPIRAPACWAHRLADPPPISRPQWRRPPAPSSSGGLRTSPWAGIPRSTLCSPFVRDVGCDPGFFYSWRGRVRRCVLADDGRGRHDQGMDRRCGRHAPLHRSRDRVAGRLEKEIQQIVESIRFE